LRLGAGSQPAFGIPRSRSSQMPHAATWRRCSMYAWIDDELATLDLNDLRLDRRARLILQRFANKPSLSIPAACDGREAEREAAYRFFSNDKIDDFEILRAHRDATVQRMAACAVVLLAQDTTEFDFTRPNEVVDGAGPLT